MLPAMRRKLSKQQRSILAEKLMDWGNLVFVGLVIGQFVPSRTSIQWGFIFAGMLGIILAYFMSMMLLLIKRGGV